VTDPGGRLPDEPETDPAEQFASDQLDDLM